MTKSDILQSAAERLLEDESLTADLVDDAAKLLLEWGLETVKRVLREKDLPPEEIDTRITELRHTMKRINRKVGQAEPEAQAEQLQMLLSEPENEEKEPENDACCTSFQDQ
jgi:hypothetical protein